MPRNFGIPDDDDEPEVGPDEGIQLPTNGPQLERELNDPTKSIIQLLDESPAWNGAWSPELLILLRSHQVLRSAFMFSLEVAREAEKILRTGNTIEELKHSQGTIAGLERYYTILAECLSQAENAERTDEVPEE